ncbi:hypothetical protein GGI43DRAFT_387665 [Trichoderma evansii]
MAASGAFKEILAAILSPNYATDLISNVYKKEENVDREILSCNASLSVISSEKMNIQLQDLRKQLAQLSSPLPRIDESVSNLLGKVSQRELEELMNFISSEMFGKSHATVTDTRIEKTGDWLLGSEDFRAWQDIPSSSAVFLLKGAGGTGKTYLTSKVIDHIRQILETSPHDEGFAYFYCNRSGSSMQQPLVVLQSFVRQLSGKAFDDSGKIQSSLVQRCSKAKREMRELSYRDCEELILESLNLYSKTTIVLDALDESDIATYNLAKYLIQMMEKTERPIKVFISSRPDREYLEEVFKDKFLITVDANNQQDDIQKYLQDKLYSTEKFKGRKQEIQDEVKDIFNTKGCGMFRWVYLQVKSLERCISDDAIHNWTQKLPRDLTEAYDQLWENIQERDESDVALAERAIKWVLCSTGPPQSAVLLEAIQYTIEGSTMVQKEKQPQQQILSLCQDLLTIDEERGVWMLPHASVAEYFESKGWTGWKCDAFASKACLGFLENFQPEKISYGTFAYYVQNKWSEHVGRYDKWLGLRNGEGADPDLEAALNRFLGSPNESSDSYRKWAEHRLDMIPTKMALFAVCNFGFYHALRDWWGEGKITEEMAIQKNERGDNSLVLAVKENAMPICRHLIDLIDVMHPEAERHACALLKAVQKGNLDILELLVMEANADVHFQPPRKTCAAQLAAERYPKSLQWMVDHNVIDMEREYDGGNVLIAAAHRGNVESVRILLGAGASVNAAVRNDRYGSVLVAVAIAAADVFRGDYVETARMLLESGADPNLLLRGGRYGSALEALATTEFREKDKEYRMRLWQLLFEAGVDPTAVFDRGEHGSALAAAAFHGHKDLLKVIIDRVGAEKAINTLRQSRHPDKQDFHQRERERRKDTVTYLVEEVGVNKDVLDTIGLEYQV